MAANTSARFSGTARIDHVATPEHLAHCFMQALKEAGVRVEKAGCVPVWDTVIIETQEHREDVRSLADEAVNDMYMKFLAISVLAVK